MILFLSKSKALRNSRADDVSSNPNTSRLETQEELMFQFEFEVSERQMYQLQEGSEGILSSFL